MRARTHYGGIVGWAVGGSWWWVVGDELVPARGDFDEVGRVPSISMAHSIKPSKTPERKEGLSGVRIHIPHGGPALCRGMGLVRLTLALSRPTPGLAGHLSSAPEKPHCKWSAAAAPQTMHAAFGQ